jgi:hypothetical protein
MCTAYFSEQWCQWPIGRVAYQLMVAKSSTRIDERRPIVHARLADIAVRDCPDLSAVPIAVTRKLGGTTAQLAGGFAVDDGEEKVCEE